MADETAADAASDDRPRAARGAPAPTVGARGDTQRGPASRAERPHGVEAAGSLRAWSGWRYEGLLALELAALCGVAFARPVLDSFGRSPETFIARGADARTVVLFGLVVVLVPPLVLALVGLATRAVGHRARGRAHLALVAAAAGVAVWRLGRDLTRWPGGTLALVAAGAAGGLAVAELRRRMVSARAFLRFAGVGSAVYLVQFLALSPTSDLVLEGGVGGVDADVAASVSAALGDDPPDVVMLVFDALPTQTLLDGSGHIDPELYPNFAAFAGTSTWYRNNTTVSMYTRDAVPAILTGRYPDPGNEPEDGPSDDPDNLFTLLGGTYDLEVVEQITQLCPEELCPRRAGGLGRLLGDAATLWRGSIPREGEDEFALPSVLDGARYDEAEQWISALDIRRDDGPQLRFYHAAIPHDPWQFLADGTRYATDRYPTGYERIGWTEVGIEVGRQRHVLQTQAADRLLGQLLGRLRAAGTFDGSLIVVTADHGHAFLPNTPWRWLAEDNYHELAWSPLLIKEPGQARGRIVDDNVMSIDILPTVADVLGLDLPWPVDGVPVDRAGERDPSVKYIDDDDDNYWRAEEGETLVPIDAREGFERVLAADPVPADGPAAVWRRTVHGGLVGRKLDDLDLASEGAGAVEVEGLDRLEGIDTREPLPIEVVGRADLRGGTYVAYALNGTIGAVTQVEPDERAGVPLVQGLLPPEVFVDGDNELTAYVVTGAPGEETLHPLEVRAAG